MSVADTLWSLLPGIEKVADVMHARPTICVLKRGQSVYILVTHGIVSLYLVSILLVY
jgi:hypothetical protein